MDATLLIHSIVRQTTVLIAQLATHAGGRAILAQTANEVFLNLVHELRAQGLGQKVIADMFGLALRTYHGKIRRLSERSTFRGRSLWDAALEYIQERGTVLQAEVLQRFRNDDQASVRGVLVDLVESGLVYKSGRGTRTTYRAARPDEYAAVEPDEVEARTANLVWVAVSRFGPVTADRISQTVPLEALALERALDALTADGRIERVEKNGIVEYKTALCLIPFGSSAGWEAAVFDHYQAIVGAICMKLRSGNTVAAPDDSIGGSTYAFTVWEGHPHHEEVLALLASTRARINELRQKVTAFNKDHTAPEAARVQVISYVGQTVLESEQRGEES
jgi:hypothetical protein